MELKNVPSREGVEGGGGGGEAGRGAEGVVFLDHHTPRSFLLLA